MSAESKSFIRLPTSPLHGPPPFIPRIMQRLSTFLSFSFVAHLSDQGVFDTMAAAGKPLTAQEISERLGGKLNAEFLYRVLRAATIDGWVKETEKSEFELQDALGLVSSPMSLKHLIEVMGCCPSHNDFKPHIPKVLQTGQPVAKDALGTDVWQWFDAHQAERDRFSKAMTGKTTAMSTAVAQLYDFSQFKSMVDLGGSQGVLCSNVKKNFPHLQTISFDLPSLTAEVSKHPLEGVEYVGGSFFESVPASDLYTASTVFHDWSDDDCRKILATVAKSIKPNGRLLLIEGILPEKGQPLDFPFQATLDLIMGTLLGAKERTRSDWEQLLQSGGFEVVSISPPLGFGTIIECQLKH